MSDVKGCPDCDVEWDGAPDACRKAILVPCKKHSVDYNTAFQEGFIAGSLSGATEVVVSLHRALRPVVDDVIRQLAAGVDKTDVVTRLMSEREAFAMASQWCSTVMTLLNERHDE